MSWGIEVDMFFTAQSLIHALVLSVLVGEQKYKR